MKKSFIFVVFSIFLASCSLNYEKDDNAEISTPEFTFINANFTRVEKNRKTIKMNADKLEQYKADSTSFAKNVEFSTFDETGKDETSGNCDFIYASINDDRYILLGDINLKILSQNLNISAESLKFDKKNEQLTSGKNQKVTINRDDMDMSGFGFSASGISNRFNFETEAEGTIETEEETENSTGDSIDTP